MHIFAAKVGLAVQGGLSVVCATCSRYWEGRERGLPDPMCTASSPCGSPLRGDDFSSYQGPITDLTRWCFVCGEPSTHAVVPTGRLRSVGVCTAHLEYLRTMRPVDLPNLVRLEAKDAMGRVVDTGVLRVLRRSLFQEIVHTEQVWAEADAEKAKG